MEMERLRQVIILEPVSAENIQIFKRVRLRALEESPSAFGSTHAREVQFDEEEWTKRALRWNGERGIGYLAVDNGDGCGIAGALLDPADESRADLVSMWTAPTHRRLGVGKLLVEAVMSWARQRGIRTLQLMVVANNEAAIRFYLGLGFAMTGHTEPYPNDAALIEYEMEKFL
jgi:GNAT superfamily N-acetyltransferase